MSRKRTIAKLLTGACELSDDYRAARGRQVQREVWTKDLMAKISAAHEAVDEAWDRRLDEMEAEEIDVDEVDDPPPFPEEEALDALLAQANAVRDHDRWPRELYWGGI